MGLAWGTLRLCSRWSVGGALLGAPLACGKSTDSAPSATAGASAAAGSGATAGASGSTAGASGSTAGNGGAAQNNGTAGNTAHGGTNSNGAAGASAGLPDPIGASSIAANSIATCAIGRAGSLACWGLLSGASEWVLPAGTFQSVAIGSSVGALRTTGEIVGIVPPMTLDDVSFIPAGQFKSVSWGVDQLCALDAAGNATCAGYPGVSDITPPAGVKFSEVGNGREFACGIRLDNAELTCWGFPSGVGPCDGIPDVGQMKAPAGRFVHLSVAARNSCAIRSDGSLACWGSGMGVNPCADGGADFGESVPPSGTFLQVSAGFHHSCGVRTDGTVACWGAGTTSGDCQSDAEACGQSIAPAGQFVQVAAGYTHSCAMRADRSVQCWGSNTGGRSTPPADFP